MLRFMSIELEMLSNHLIVYRPFLLPPSIFPSIRVFSNESALCIRWPKDWSLASASVLPVNIQDWFPLGWTGWISLQSEGFSSLPQHHSSKASIQKVKILTIYSSKGRLQKSRKSSMIMLCFVEKEMATHSSVLAWRIPGMGEPSGLPSMGSHRVGHDWSDLAAAAVCCVLGCAYEAAVK